MRYKATDVSKQMMFDSVSNVDKAHLPAAQIMPCETKKSWETSSIVSFQFYLQCIILEFYVQNLLL